VSFMAPNPDGTVRVSVAPPSSGLSRASGAVPTVAGPVSVTWQRRGGGMALELVVPSNASALVHLPTTNPSTVRESGVPASRAPGVAVFSPSAGRARLSVGSGSYRFTAS
jgi:alpha-L-rhamnosidase